jgi:hypothetical protein
MINRKWYYAEAWPEMALLIDEAIENLEQREIPHIAVPGMMRVLCFRIGVTPVMLMCRTIFSTLQ